MSGHVYLAGPITGLSYDEGQEWRDIVRPCFEKYGYVARSPLRGKAYLRDKGTLTPEDYGHVHPLSGDHGIVTRDRNDTITAALVFANLLGADRVSSGTCIELGWADVARVPSIVVMEEGGLHDTHMVRGVSGFVMRSLDAAVDLALTILGENLDLEAQRA